MRVHVIDPSAYTPPYDHALCQALGQAGAEVELITSRFAYASAPIPCAYERRELFYRRSHAPRASGRRTRTELAVKLGEHLLDMLRYRRLATAAEVIHFQWLTVQPLDLHLLPPLRPLVITAHDVLPREPRPGQLAAQRRLYQRMDAIVVHSAHGQRRLVEELGCDPQRTQLIPHGVLRPWEGLPELPLPVQLRDVEGPVVLFFGLLRPYKGIDVLLDAWKDIAGAELWIVGMPRMDIVPLCERAGPTVRFVTQFIPDAQIRAFLQRASLVVLPYREIDQSGVLFTTLGSGTPLLLSDVGGFPEIAAKGAAETFPAGDAACLRSALTGLLEDRARRTELAACGRELAGAEHSWAQIARAHLQLYERLL